VAQASKALGLSRSRLYEKLEELGIKPDAYRKAAKQDERLKTEA
jgi:DNA-binding NtrC family response regulator